MSRTAPSSAFSGTATTELGQGDRINRDVSTILARKPEVAKAFGALQSKHRTTGTVTPRLVELPRLRIAYHHQCRSCMSIRYQSAIDDGVTEDAVSAWLHGRAHGRREVDYVD